MEVPNQDNRPEVQHAGHEALEFIRRNVQAVAIVAGVVVLVMLVVMAYVMQQRRSSETASQMLAVAESPKQLEELLAQYPSSAAAPVAMLALASRQFSSGAYDQAAIQYIHFLQQYPRHAMAAVAELGKVMCFEARGETEQALTGFDGFITAHPGHFLLPQALMGKARCLQQVNRAPEALAIYENYIAANPEGDWKTQMEMARSFMERAQRSPKNETVFVPPAVPAPAVLPVVGPK